VGGEEAGIFCSAEASNPFSNQSVLFGLSSFPNHGIRSCEGKPLPAALPRVFCHTLPKYSLGVKPALACAQFFFPRVERFPIVGSTKRPALA
jgi:hypothetical protein